MSEPTNIWGTMSVLDHLRPNAFVAELVLFDTLVIPRPAGNAEWPEAWNIQRQHQLLDLIPQDRIMEVPWTEDRRAEWKKMMVSASAQDDVRDVQEARARDEREADSFDAPGFQVSRRILVDYVDRKRDEVLVQGIPQTPVAVIPAYESSNAYLFEAGKQQERLLQAFGWEFLVPHHETANGKSLTHGDQIRAALDLAAIPEVRQHRDAFRAWTSLEAIKGTSTDEARGKMEDMIARYAQAVASSKIPVRLKWGAGISEFLGAAAALMINPAFALISPLIKLGETAIGSPEAFGTDVPSELKPAALIHAARDEFSRKELDLFSENELAIRIQDHWPNGAPPLYL